MGLSENIVDVTESSFEQDVIMRSHEVPVVVDFWAEWCGPCRILGPILERLAIESGGRFTLAKVDVDENQSLAVRYGVQGIPAVKAFRHGEVVAEFVGAQPENRVREFVSNLAPSPEDEAVAEAQSLLGTRHWDEAEEAYRAVLDEDETNSTAALGLVQSLLLQGKGREALKWIENFPAGTEWAEAEKLTPLAELLVEAEECEQTDHEDPLEAQLHRAASLIESENIPGALDGFLEILREDKGYRGGLPKQAMLGIFSMLGDDDSLTREYREELASVLF